MYHILKEYVAGEKAPKSSCNLEKVSLTRPTMTPYYISMDDSVGNTYSLVLLAEECKVGATHAIKLQFSRGQLSRKKSYYISTDDLFSLAAGHIFMEYLTYAIISPPS